MRLRSNSSETRTEILRDNDRTRNSITKVLFVSKSNLTFLRKLPRISVERAPSDIDRIHAVRPCGHSFIEF
jgi:hypothetical protein